MNFYSRLKGLTLVASLVACLVACLLVVGCSQDRLIPQPPSASPASPLPPATPGRADFSRVVFIGDGWLAGQLNGTLYDQGQRESAAAILYKQLISAGAPSPIQQPDINSPTGYNPLHSDPVNNVFLGRLRVQGFATISLPSSRSAWPAPPTLNSAFDFGGDRTALHNYAAPYLRLIDLQSPRVGDWSTFQESNTVLNPYYARFATTGGTPLADALLQKPTFFVLFTGLQDILAYAAAGASPEAPPPTPLTQFAEHYSQVLDQLLAVHSNTRGLVVDLPALLNTLPYFTYNNPKRYYTNSVLATLFGSTLQGA